jgi:hypothetical protein
MSNLPATNGDPMKAFQDRVLEKLRTDIGAMLPDEALSGLVAKAVEDQFFKKRPKSFNYRGDPETWEASWFVAEVTKVAEPLIQSHIKRYVTENAETIRKAVDEFLSTQNLMLVTTSAIHMQTQQQIFETARQIHEIAKRGY